MKKGEDVVVIDTFDNDHIYTVEKGEKKIFLILLTDGKNCDGSVKVIIRGSDANVTILGIVLGFGSQHINLYTLQEHVAPGSVSDLLIKSVLFGASRLRYSGLISIAKNAQRSNAYQKNQNLLMSKQAWADSKPALEILANDVRCTHGATVGTINTDQLYYLQTRGLSRDVAEKLIIEGFVGEVIGKIPDAALRKKIEKTVLECLRNIEG